MAGATVEKVIGARRSRLARIDEGIEQREAKLAETRREIVELASREQEAAAEALRRDPAKSAYALRSPAHELKRKRLELEKSVGTLEQELALLKSDRVAADAGQAGRELAERTDEMRDARTKVREARLAATKAFITLGERWGVLAEALTAQSALRQTVAGEQLVQRVGIFDRDAIELWQEVADFEITPIPVDLRGFLDELLEAATGDRTDVEAEHAAVDEINARRREIAKRAPGGFDDLPLLPKPVIEPNPLHELVPDLRGKVATADVTGAPIRRGDDRDREPAPIAGVVEAGFGSSDLPSSAMLAPGPEAASPMGRYERPVTGRLDRTSAGALLSPTQAELDAAPCADSCRSRPRTATAARPGLRSGAASTAAARHDVWAGARARG